MLGLVNVSQSYVGDIVADYYKGKMSEMVSDLSMFTETATGPTYEIDDYRDPKDSEQSVHVVESQKVDDDDSEEFVISVRSKQ